ncbi:SulP family inorganic anion transporter [Microbacterium oxydans]|uniref:SulP family inorganic anion transporter n=1 Tax=Microbacterium oxydans TaxID=82380 RepID=UPI0024ADEBA1|nr:SulP family inorganic anion transporter [Microbacterium oxydans]
MTATRRPPWLFSTVEGYRREWVVRDVVAGLSAGAVVIPQGMAYATIANLPVQVGLYTCILPMLVYAFLGGSRAMSVSTTSTIATLTATTLVSAGVAAGSDDAIGSLMMLTLLVGVILLIARLCRLGSLVENISGATVLGLKIGVGATVAVGQLPKLLGESYNFSGHGFLKSLGAVAQAFDSVNWPTVALSAGSILVIVVLKRFAPRVPGTLVAVVAGILLVAFAGLDRYGVDLIAPVPSGLPVPGIPDFSQTVSRAPWLPPDVLRGRGRRRRRCRTRPSRSRPR